jgi:predicted amidohydrolase YtcJ
MSSPRAEPDLILRNADIHTMDARRPRAAALAIRDGRINAVGSDAEMSALAGPASRVVDLRGRMVLPGLVDVHSHFVWAGRAELYEVRFAPTLSLDQILDQVATAAAKEAADGWVVGGIWGSPLLDSLNSSEARHRLDVAAGGRPVMLRDDSHHNRWVSSAALRIAGIDDATPDPVNGTIVRDPNTGAATGLLLESAGILVEGVLAESQAREPQRDVDAALHALKRFNAYGITATQESLSTRTVMQAIRALDDSGRMTAWVVGSMPVVETAIAHGDFGAMLFDDRERYRSRHFRPDAGKILLDGVPTMARTSAMLEPYLPDARHGCCFRGGTMLTVPQLARALADCEARGIAVKIHCAGDAATRAALDAVEVLRTFNGPGLAHHIAHASFIDPVDVPRFAELNVVADLSPMLWFPGVIVEAIRAAVPKDRVDHFWPNRDLHEAGALLAGGSDWPVVSDPDPWLGMQGMVTRRDPTGRFPGALWPEQALDVATVLRIYTINGARALNLADEIGSLEPGKSADLIVIDRDLMAVPAEQIAGTRVLATYFEGRLVHGTER